MLKKNTLFGIEDKVKIAIERIRAFEPEDGYWLAFSGGKDSQCIYHLTVDAGVKFTAHYNLTTVDPPELVHFIKEKYPDVIFEYPELSMWKLIEKKGMLPTRIIRYCCTELKENRTPSGVSVLMGVRRQESAKRSKRKVVEKCWKNKTIKWIAPIVDWSEDEVWEYIKEYKKIPYCKLYDEGEKRLGCIMCPMSGEKGMVKDKEKYPKYYRAYCRAVKRAMENGKFGRYKTVEDAMEWWIHGKKEEETDEETLFKENRFQ